MKTLKLYASVAQLGGGEWNKAFTREREAKKRDMMDQINSSKTYAICVLMAVTCSCQSQSTQNFESELLWKQDWMSTFFLEYRKYEEKTLPNCSDAKREVSFDIERKIRGLCDIPFESVMFTVKKYIKSNNIKFDSIIMINVHSPIFECEYTFPSVSFYIFRNNLMKELYVYVDDDKKCTIKHPLKIVDVIEAFKRPSPGCGYGYISFTKFDQKWIYRIQDIIINPDESY